MSSLKLNLRCRLPPWMVLVTSSSHQSYLVFSRLPSYPTMAMVNKMGLRSGNTSNCPLERGKREESGTQMFAIQPVKRVTGQQLVKRNIKWNFMGWTPILFFWPLLFLLVILLFLGRVLSMSSKPNVFYPLPFEDLICCHYCNPHSFLKQPQSTGLSCSC